MLIPAVPEKEPFEMSSTLTYRSILWVGYEGISMEQISAMVRPVIRYYARIKGKL